MAVALRSPAQTPTTEPAKNHPQTTTEPQKSTTNAGGQPSRQVLFDSRNPPPSTPAAPSSTGPSTALPQSGPELTDQDRAAIDVTHYDLDIRITPATASLTARARVTVHNHSDRTLHRIALQISSSLVWQSATLQPGGPIPIAQHLLDTDADHTGQVSELILPVTLSPGQTIALDTFYSGSITPSAARLERLGATPDQALATDWDAISPDSTALRGFGNVLWFPVAAPQLFLSDNSLVPAIGKARLAHAQVPIHLRLSVNYTGEPPTAAYFCGRRQSFSTLSDNPNAPITSGSGIATANFSTEPIGIRPLSLFILPQPETLLPSTTTTATPLLAVETTDNTDLPQLVSTAERIAPLLETWFGPHSLSTLTIIDHPGQPFEDGPLLVAPLTSLLQPDAFPQLAHSLTHAWVQTGQPWMDEGLAEFVSLLWTEREKGRDAALAQLNALMQPVIAAETAPQTPASSENATDTTSSSSTAAQSPVGQPLITASDELFYRRKAAAVWWMLRDIAGEQPLQLALTAWRTQSARHDSPQSQAEAFEALLEKTSGKDLTWFFDDWILHDRGLPNLSIVDVAPRQLPAGPGHGSGWLVAVTMRNQGTAAAEVPLVIRSGTLSITKRIRIPAMSNITDRELVQTPPTEVVLNDGSTPETGASVHTRTVVIHNE
ncbi:MAG TPA: hypothetical protein VHY48_12420 [Acidobacteriaceae bacterium]|jgi:hypothetical protein|nr:hypothetical protein [Acidobacteriaceae bacterium]